MSTPMTRSKTIVFVSDDGAGAVAQVEGGYVNGGSRGFLIGIENSVLLDLTRARLADLAVD